MTRVDPIEIRAAIEFFSEALGKASKGYSPTTPEQARAAVRIAIVGTINLISALYPDEPSFPLPLNQLLYDLKDLDHGRVAVLFQPTKVANRPPNATSEELFRAMVAAAMTRLMDGRKVKLDEAARDIARRLSKMGCEHPSGRPITGPQIAGWREKMMDGTVDLDDAPSSSALKTDVRSIAVEFDVDLCPDFVGQFVKL